MTRDLLVKCGRRLVALLVAKLAWKPLTEHLLLWDHHVDPRSGTFGVARDFKTSISRSLNMIGFRILKCTKFYTLT
jgi:hypothetical protein